MNTHLTLLNRMLVVMVLVFAVAFTLPNLLPEQMREKIPAFLPKHAMTLGLDLQGGAHLTLEVATDDVLVHAYENLTDDIRRVAREGGMGYTGLRSDATGAKLVLRDPLQQTALQAALGAGVVVTGEGTTGNIAVTLTETAQTELLTRAMQQTLQVLRSRVDEFGVAEPLVQRQGANRVIVQLPGAKDTARAKASIGRTAMLTFHLVDDQANPLGILAPTQMKLEETTTDTEGNVVNRQPLIVTKRPALTGDMLTSAAASFDQYGTPAVDIAFDRRGTQVFADISTKHVGQRFAIVLDGKVYSAPVFREPILGGRAQISGRFQVEEAQDLAAILNAGALPAAVKVVEERTVGPTLGADSVRAGQIAIMAGLAGVFVFMGVFYGLFGLFAVVALVVNFLILVACMTAFGFTLTLPGMAGIVLTLGMAVDANVLIFERIREETGSGKKPLSAIHAGFEGAFSAIMDSNITTLLAAAVCFLLGSGPVKGFAVSLIIGLCASMFTAITLTRWMLLAWYFRTRPTKLPV
ncbi:MAG: protein translocase subunit SecD [Alphaproteobacteria bacterium]